jgi:hypothetical protein
MVPSATDLRSAGGNCSPPLAHPRSSPELDETKIASFVDPLVEPVRTIDWHSAGCRIAVGRGRGNRDCSPIGSGTPAGTAAAAASSNPRLFTVIDRKQEGRDADPPNVPTRCSAPYFVSAELTGRAVVSLVRGLPVLVYAWLTGAGEGLSRARGGSQAAVSGVGRQPASANNRSGTPTESRHCRVKCSLPRRKGTLQCTVRRDATV